MSLLLSPSRAPVYRGFLLAEPFGVWLKRTRNEKKLTLEEVGDALNTTHVTIQRYEAGARKVPIDAVPQLADALGVPRPKAVAAWIAANTGDDELTRELDFEGLPVPEGYNDLDDHERAFVSESMRRTVETLLRAKRQGGFGYAAVDPDNELNAPSNETAEGSTGDGNDHTAGTSD